MANQPNQSKQSMGDTAKENIARQQEMKVTQQRTSSGETSTAKDQTKAQGAGDTDVETARNNQREAGDAGNVEMVSDVEQDQLGGREAGGNAGTGGVSTNDVGNSKASKQPTIEH